MRVLKILAALIACAGLSAETLPPDYVEGQVWEYRTRPGEEGSRLKIQQIETDPAFPEAGAIYHISIVGLRLRNGAMSPQLSHAPVSRETLDRSVTELSETSPTFPDVEPGIAQWRADRGGIFTITVAEIVDLVDAQTAG